MRFEGHAHFVEIKAPVAERFRACSLSINREERHAQEVPAAKFFRWNNSVPFATFSFIL